MPSEQDINKKLAIAKHVLDECKRTCIFPANEDIPTDIKFKKMTGENADNYKNQSPTTSTLSMYEKMQLANNDEQNDAKYKAIHNYLVEAYLKDRRIPSIDEIAVRLSLNIEHKCAGFIWQQLPNMSNGIFIEKPEIIAKRIIYLKKIEDVREKKQHIIHLDYKFVDNEYGTRNGQTVTYFTAASAAMGIIRQDVYETSNPVFANKCLIHLVKCIDKGSVLVLEELPNDTPTVNSSRSVMLKWLEKHNIKHDPAVHRSVLYELIQKADIKVKSEDEKLITDFGHEVLYRPNEIDELNFLAPFWKRVDISRQAIDASSGTFDDHVQRVGKMTSEEQWKKWDANLEIIEKNTYVEDLLMEEVIDKLMVLAAHGQLPEETEGLTPNPYWMDAFSEIVI